MASGDKNLYFQQNVDNTEPPESDGLCENEQDVYTKILDFEGMSQEIPQRKTATNEETDSSRKEGNGCRCGDRPDRSRAAPGNKIIRQEDETISDAPQSFDSNQLLVSYPENTSAAGDRHLAAGESSSLSRYSYVRLLQEKHGVLPRDQRTEFLGAPNQKASSFDVRRQRDEPLQSHPQLGSVVTNAETSPSYSDVTDGQSSDARRSLKASCVFSPKKRLNAAESLHTQRRSRGLVTGYFLDGSGRSTDGVKPSLLPIPGSDEPLVILPITNPQRDMYREELYRRSTFDEVQDLPVPPDQLAENGFYYDKETKEIICFSCGLKKRHWAEHEKNKVAMIHLQLSEDCRHAAFKDPNNVAASADFPNDSASSHDAETASNAGNKNSPRYLTDGDTSATREAPCTGERLQAAKPASDQSGVTCGSVSDALGSRQSWSSSSLSLPKPQSHPKLGNLATGAGEIASAEFTRPLVGAITAQALLTTQPSLHSPRETQSQPRATLGSSEVEAASPSFNLPVTVENDPAASRADNAENSALASTYNSEEAPNLDRCPNRPGDRRNSGGSHSAGYDAEEARVRDWVRREAVSPVYAPVATRLMTFVGWPTTAGLPSPRSLVVAGFYCISTGPRCSVRCFFCGVTVKDCAENFDPWVMHVQLRFSCGYVTAVKGEPFVCQTMRILARGRSLVAPTQNGAEASSPSLTTSGSDGRSRAGPRAGEESQAVETDSLPTGSWSTTNASASGTTTAVTRAAVADAGSAATPSAAPASARTAPRPPTTPRPAASVTTTTTTTAAAAAASASSDPASTRARRLMMTTTAPSSSSSLAASSSTLPTTAGRQSTVTRSDGAWPRARAEPVDVTGLQRLREVNRRLSRRFLCRLCGHRPVDTIFLPCGHLCTCEMCSGAVDFCCLCNARIGGTARVILGELD